MQLVDGWLRAPLATGRWALVIDVVDDVDGSFAKLGSAPAVVILNVMPPQDRPAVD